MGRKWQSGLCVALFTVVPVLAGCGGSGSNSTPAATRSVPTAQTKTRVQQLFGGAVRSLTQAGFQTTRLASSLNSAPGLAASAPSPSGAGTVATFNTGNAGIPMIGAFLRNMATSAAANGRAQHAAHHIGRDSEPVPSPLPPVPYPSTSFYFDYYLGLWVATDDGLGQSTYLLYSDEGKTQPAGSIVTVWPTDYMAYPQTYSSSYSFTAGYLAGAHGESKSVTAADGLSKNTYSDTYADGSKDSGASTYTPTGDSSWTGRTDASDGTWTTVRGGFRSDGSGGTHTEMSDGYIADSTFNADGTGRTKITGPDPGLPCTITWDPYGNTTITYADGSTQFFAGWSSFNGGGGGPIPVDPIPVASGGGIASSGSATGGSTTPVATPPPAPK